MLTCARLTASPMKSAARRSKSSSSGWAGPVYLCSCTRWQKTFPTGNTANGDGNTRIQEIVLLEKIMRFNCSRFIIGIAVSMFGVMACTCAGLGNLPGGLQTPYQQPVDTGMLAPTQEGGTTSGGSTTSGGEAGGGL